MFVQSQNTLNVGNICGEFTTFISIPNVMSIFQCHNIYSHFPTLVLARSGYKGQGHQESTLSRLLPAPPVIQFYSIQINYSIFIS
ncbi:hypothetical protein DFR59_10126 [Falsibacillus pallidus]|uniref:Uncharacterized protein n=1 Tax=Falsibacillus pallidus TaxID=493781 RepID=A0A370GUK5_9BACI|nr:hypothetical protein DFR59_10126 [Falsibacillus pallidus]